jgi:hypothetical protein
VLLPPEAQEGGFIFPHIDAGVGAADEHLIQVIGAVLEVDGVSVEWDRLRGVPGQGGDEFGVRYANGGSSG